MPHRHLLLATFLITLLAGCSPYVPPPSTQVAAPAAPIPSAQDFPWWNDAVFYEIFVRSFQDSDGDGIGDLQGLIDRLDYLNDGDPATTDDLGVTGLWLMPICRSPSYHGYDVTDYMTVEEDYGTNENFRRLMDACHERGIRVITDLVLNHSSRNHPWFQQAAASEINPYRSYYVWSPANPGFQRPWGGNPWHRTPTGYYYGLFSGGMPDLNYRSPAVTQEMKNVIRFWLEDMNVDGFRLDAIKHLIEQGPVQEHTAATHHWLQGFHRYYRSIDPEAVTVAEIWSDTRHVVPYIGNEVDVAFEFSTAGAILASARSEQRGPIRDAHRHITSVYPPQQYATFLTNHDQNRVMSELGENVNHAKVAASLLLTGPGIPFLYYGEEVGQIGTKPDPRIRTPMPWTADPGLGFTDGDRLWARPQAGDADRCVSLQTGAPSSLLSHYRRLIHLRNRTEALRVGVWSPVETPNLTIYTFLRRTQDQTVLVAVNLGSQPVRDLSLRAIAPGLSPRRAINLWTGEELRLPLEREGGGFDGYRPVQVLPPYSTLVVELR